MFEVECPSCKASYQVDERRVPPTGLKMRCPKCGESFQVEPRAAREKQEPVLGAALGLGARASGQGKSTMLGVPAAAPPPRPAPPAQSGPAAPPRPAPPRPLKQTMIGVAPAQSLPPPPSELELESFEELDLTSSDPEELEAELPSVHREPLGRGASFSEFDDGIELPSPGSKKSSTGEIDLPSMLPSADDEGEAEWGEAELPDIPGTLGLPERSSHPPAAAPATNLPSLGAGLPTRAAELDEDFALPDLSADLPDLDAALPDLDAPLPSMGAGGQLPEVSPHLPLVGGSLPSSSAQLPEREREGAPPRPRGSWPPPAGVGSSGAEAAVNRAVDPTNFGEVDLSGGEDDEFDAFPTETASPNKSEGSATYGEVALDGGGGGGGLALGEDVERAPAPTGGPAPAAAASAQVTLPGPAPANIPIPPTRPRASKGTKIAAVVAVAAALGGGALALLPDVGPYGAYFFLDLARAGRYESDLARDVAAAATRLGLDTADEVEAAFREVNRGRPDAPRFRPRSAYVAYLGLWRRVRFGGDSNVVAEAQVALDGLNESVAAEVEHLELARLASLLAQGNAANVTAQANSVIGRGADWAALVGEAALAQGDAELAWRAFSGVDRGESARGAFGLARAAYALGKKEETTALVERTLAKSTSHVGARLLSAELELSERKQDEPLVEKLTALVQPNQGASTSERVRAFSLLGELHLSRSRVKQAELAFTEALRLEAGNARAQRGLADTLFESGRFGEALARYEAAAQAAPRDLDAVLGVVRAKLRLEGLEDAAKLLDRLAAQHPKSTAVSYWVGRAKEAIGEQEAARKAYELAVEVGDERPELVNAYVALTRLLGQAGKSDEASRVISEAEKRFPSNPEVYRALGELAVSRGAYEEGIRHYDAALALDPKNIGLKFARGVALRQARRFDESKAEFDAVEAVEKDYPGLALERGNLFEASGRTEEALRAYEAALALAPTDPDLMLRVGCGKANAGQADSALELLRKVVEERPNSAEANFCQGVALLQQGSNLPEARRFLERAVGLDATRATYHLYVGRVGIESHDYALAGRALERALELDRSLADAYWQRGVLRVRQGAVKDAEIDLRKALELSPSRTEAHAALAEAYMQTGKEQNALVEWKAALVTGHGEPFWYYRYGKLLLDNRQVDEARAALQKAVDEESRRPTPQPWIWEAHRSLALSMGRTKDAIPHWEAFLENADKRSPYVQEALRELKAIVR